MFKIFNSQWQPTPEQPFATIDEAKRHILSLLEVYDGPFYIVKWDVVYKQDK